MAGLFFWRRQQQDDEQILASLDNQIRRTEARISLLRQRRQRVKAAWLYYSVSIYVLVLVAYFTYLKPRRDPWDIWLWKTGFVVLGAPLIYGGRRFIIFWYTRKEDAEREQLSELKIKQRAKVDDLKKNESYRRTQLLLERYDTPTKEANAAKNGPNRGPLMPGAKDAPNPLNAARPNISGPNGPPPSLVVPPGRNGIPLGPNGIAPGMSGVPPAIPGQKPSTPLPSPVPVMSPNNLMPPTDNWRQSPTTSVPGSPGGPPATRGWFDKVIDVMIGGDEGPANKFALICEECFTHNGLVPPQAYSNAKFRCMHCNHFNAPKSYDRHSFDSRRASQLTERSDNGTGDLQGPWRAEDSPQASPTGSPDATLLRRPLQFSNCHEDIGADSELHMQPITESENAAALPPLVSESSASAVDDVGSQAPQGGATSSPVLAASTASSD
ncbi:hypothetical protein BDZ88DRAFT_173910 [Geranomyces variabilis]|nr:hypothetical protein BDZ88DRAFT_173910 [Geranomyces variabilis]KAJ3139038.1 hypothetical protein HDU90_000944 [Geranomyces variabilis]